MTLTFIQVVLVIMGVMIAGSSAMIDITQCVTYRYVPCVKGKIVDKSIVVSNDDTYLIPFDESTCISYQFVPCDDGGQETSLSLVYYKGAKSAVKFSSTNCLNETALAIVLLEKNACVNNLTAIQNNFTAISQLKINCDNNLANVSQGKSSCEKNLVTISQGKINCENNLTAIVQMKNNCDNNLTAISQGRNSCEKNLTTIQNDLATISQLKINCDNNLVAILEGKNACENNLTTAVKGKTDCETSLTDCNNNLTTALQKKTDCETSLATMLQGKLANCQNNLTTIIQMKNICEGNLSTVSQKKNDCENQLATTESNLNDAILQIKNACESNLTKCDEKIKVQAVEMKNIENDFEARYNRVIREKKFLSDYMVSVWDTRSIEEDAEKVKPIKNRMQDYIRYSVARLGLHELVDVVKLKPNFGTVYNDVLSFKYPLNIQACPYTGPSSLPSLFVAVSSVAGDNNQKLRDDMRISIKREITQQRMLFSSITYGFFLGKPDDSNIQNSIEQESVMNKDVVQVDIVDNGKNNSLKLAAIFNWVRLNCENVDVVFKIDENYSKFSLKTLGKTLPERNIPDILVYGVKGDTTPYREGKRNISMEEFPWTSFPAYFNGLAYFFTGNMITPLMAAFQTIPMISLEDVYLGICIIKSDMKRFTYCGRDINSSSCF